MNGDIEQLYTPTPEAEQFESELEQSLGPRGPAMLLDMVRAAALPPAAHILDVGCGAADWACQLAEQCGPHTRVTAIDVVPLLLDLARRQVAEKGLTERVTVVAASIADITAPSGAYDLVWCRDMLNHIADLEPALRECARVVRPGGAMLVYQAFAGELLEPREAERLYRALGIVPYNMAMAHVEQAFAAAGLHIVKKEVIAGEWREHEVEHEDPAVKRLVGGLLSASRLLRRREEFVSRYGERLYEQALGDAQWYAFIMLGKLLPVAYLLRKEGA